MASPNTNVSPPAGRGRTEAAILLVVAGAFTWACWTTFDSLEYEWSTNPQYSHGYLVPFFSAFLLWHRRSKFNPTARGGWAWWLVVGAGCGLKLVGAYYILVWPERVSTVIILTGLFGVFGGRPAIRWAWPALAFLVFMIPPPGRFETMLSGPLQRIATLVSANILQTLGFFAHADGTIIILSEVDLGVVEACSGLRMLIAFLAMSTAIALVLDRPAWQKILVVLGAAPVALICNIGRIVVTAIMHETVGKKWADLVFHDLAGWLMMPAGLLLLWVELWFLGKVWRPDPNLEKLTVSPKSEHGGNRSRTSQATGAVAHSS